MTVADPMREELAVELYSVVGTALKSFGMSAAEQQRAIRRARQLSATPRVSGPLLCDLRSLSELLLAWVREPEFLDPNRRPRVLAIAGAGATFETLGKRFLPGLPLESAVALACRSAEVTRRPGGKIALLGGVLVDSAHSFSRALAHGIRQVDQLLTAIVHNTKVRHQGMGVRHTERMLLSVITRSQFDELMRELRPQIDDFMRRIESAVEPRRPKTRRSLKSATAVSVGLYVSREEDFARAGVDPDSLGIPIPRR